MDANETLLDAREVGRLLTYTPQRINALVRRKAIPFIALPGGDIRFSPSEIQRWIELRRCPVAGGVA